MTTWTPDGLTRIGDVEELGRALSAGSRVAQPKR